MCRSPNEVVANAEKKTFTSQFKSGNHNNILDRTAEQSVFFYLFIAEAIT